VGKIGPYDLFHRELTVQAKQTHVVQIGPAHRVKNRKFLAGDNRTQSIVSADTQQLSQRLGLFAVQHIIENMKKLVLVLGLLIQ